MTHTNEVNDYCKEFIRVFESRTPAIDIESVLPQTRVGRSEMHRWFRLRFGRNMTLDDTLDLEQPMIKVFQLLRNKYPNERW